MPGSAAKLQITERQQAVLRQIVAAPTSPVRLVQRAEIILRAFAKEQNQAIAAAIDLDPTAVGLWRRRWVKAWPKLIRIECTETQAAFRRTIEDVLSDRPRSGNPGKFTPEQITQILALACEPCRNAVSNRGTCWCRCRSRAGSGRRESPSCRPRSARSPRLDHGCRGGPSIRSGFPKFFF